jgi:hypothetical protein
MSDFVIGPDNHGIRVPGTSGTGVRLLDGGQFLLGYLTRLLGLLRRHH